MQNRVRLSRAIKSRPALYLNIKMFVKLPGSRVFLFLQTDDFWRDYHNMLSKGIEFVREPNKAPYGIIAVFKDLYGNLWDLLQPI
jgi:uncharacterized glyoxalase superfamily protein PhnB